MTDSVYVGNTGKDAPLDRGWLLGHFKEVGDPRHSEAVEIKWRVHPHGDERPQWVRGEARTALLVLVSGRFRVELPGHSVVPTRAGRLCRVGARSRPLVVRGGGAGGTDRSVAVRARLRGDGDGPGAPGEPRWPPERNLPGNDHTTRHHSDRITDPIPDQRKYRLRIRNNKNHLARPTRLNVKDEPAIGKHTKIRKVTHNPSAGGCTPPTPQPARAAIAELLLAGLPRRPQANQERLVNQAQEPWESLSTTPPWRHERPGRSPPKAHLRHARTHVRHTAVRRPPHAKRPSKNGLSKVERFPLGPHGGAGGTRTHGRRIMSASACSCTPTSRKMPNSAVYSCPSSSVAAPGTSRCRRRRRSDARGRP